MLITDVRPGEPDLIAGREYATLELRALDGASGKLLGRCSAVARRHAVTVRLSARPAFMANQLGHSLQVFFQVYAKWINSKDDRVEIAKLDQAIAQLPQSHP